MSVCRHSWPQEGTLSSPLLSSPPLLHSGHILSQYQSSRYKPSEISMCEASPPPSDPPALTNSVSHLKCPELNGELLGRNCVAV